MSEHLDDDVLSAVLDGEAAATESAHADTCAECGARLAALRDASLLVRTPVAPADDDRREAAIAAALAAAPSNLVPLRSRRRAVPTWLGAAAAAVVAVAAIGLVARSGDDDADQTAADSGGDSATTEETFATADDSAGGDAAPESEAGSSTMMRVEPAEGGDLGALDDLDLEATVEDALLQRQALDGADEDAAATTTAPAPSSATGSYSTSCEDAVRADDPTLGALVYRASGTDDGDPAEVLAFDVLVDDGSRVERRVLVVALDGCEVRQSEQYAV
jgi:hypothetical protein